MKNNVDRRQREKQEMRLRVLDAARELFISGGEEAVTLRGVAERIEYSATTIYLYFPNKEALIQALCLEDFMAYSHLFKQAERIVDPLARLRQIARTYVDFGLLHPAHYRAMFMTPANGAQALEKSESDGSVQPLSSPPHPYDFLHTAVFKAMAAGCFKAQYRDVAAIAQVIWSGLHGVISLHLVRSRYAAVNWRPVQTAADMMIECLIGGMIDEISASNR